jgi:hypothetical protein
MRAGAARFDWSRRPPRANGREVAVAGCNGGAVLLVFGFAALSWPLFEVEEGLLDIWMEEHRMALGAPCGYRHSGKSGQEPD